MKSCVIYETMNVIGKKWTLLIVFEIYRNDEPSFNQLKKAVKYITPKMLSQRLSELEENKLIKRKVILKPLRSTYSLTYSGKDLIKILEAIKSWSKKWAKPVNCKGSCKDCEF